MRRIKKPGITALTAAIALSLGAVPVALTVPAIVASGDEPTTLDAGTSHSTPYGQLVLETGATDQITLVQNGIAVGDPQQLSGNSRSCLLESTGGALLDFSGTFSGIKPNTNAASFSGDSIGVAEKKSGTSCYRVDSGTAEELTLSLGSDALSTSTSVKIDSATLDVELKQGARILATAYSDGAPVGYFDLAGATVVKNVLVEPGDAPYEFDRLSCGDAADNGPDSGASDNCAWAFSQDDELIFDSVTLKAVTGSFSLEGGGDWGTKASENRSVLELVSGLCVGDSQTLGLTGDPVKVTVTRLGDAAGTGGCVPYTFTKDGKGAELLKPLGQSGSAQFVFDFVWTLDADISAGVPLNQALVKRTVVDFDGPVGNDPTVIASCPDLETVTLDGVTYQVVQGVEDNEKAPDLADGYPTVEKDTKQFACIVTQSIVPADPLDGVDRVTVTERIYAYGDIRLSKP